MSSKSRIRFHLIALSATAIIISGCVNPVKMALSEGAGKQSLNDKSIYLMALTLKNSYRPSFQPQLMTVHVENVTNSNKMDFAVDDKTKRESDDPTKGNYYLISMELPQGKYVLRGFNGIGTTFPIIGTYFVPLHASFESSAPGVFYLGHVEANLRERNGDEFKAGPSLPLIDQAVVGASGGTFDIEISDQLERDKEWFQYKYPAMKSVDVQKSILPSFDRSAAQRWWEAH